MAISTIPNNVFVIQMASLEIIFWKILVYMHICSQVRELEYHCSIVMVIARDQNKA